MFYLNTYVNNKNISLIDIFKFYDLLKEKQNIKIKLKCKTYCHYANIVGI